MISVYVKPTLVVRWKSDCGDRKRHWHVTACQKLQASGCRRRGSAFLPYKAEGSVLTILCGLQYIMYHELTQWLHRIVSQRTTDETRGKIMGNNLVHMSSSGWRRDIDINRSTLTYTLFHLISGTCIWHQP